MSDSIEQPPVTVKPEIPAPSAPSSNYVVHVPSYSRWFNYDEIHECEVKSLPELLSKKKNAARVYKYFRNSIVKRYRENPSRKLTFTDVRKTLVGDVGSIRRVFDFLETWGLINYSPPPTPTSVAGIDKKESLEDPNKSAAGVSSGSPPQSPSSAQNKRRTCGGCKSACSIACFSCDKYDMTLCARCYVRGNYRNGLTSSDFRRIEIGEESRRDWTPRETLQLLEAITHYGDDWKKVSQHVNGKTEKDCIAHFIKLPFGEEFSGYRESGEVDGKYDPIRDSGSAVSGTESGGPSSPNKRIRLTPLADASNPIMAQAAFLSTLAGVEVAEAAARAAVAALTEVEYGPSGTYLRSLPRNSRQQDAGAESNGETKFSALETACLEANSVLEKEEMDVGHAISRIIGEQMKEIQEKIVRFEKLDLQMEKEWQQYEQMKHLLFVDQLNHLFTRSSTPKAVGPKDEIVRTD